VLDGDKFATLFAPYPAIAFNLQMVVAIKACLPLLFCLNGFIRIPSVGTPTTKVSVGSESALAAQAGSASTVASKVVFIWVALIIRRRIPSLLAAEVQRDKAPARIPAALGLIDLLAWRDLLLCAKHLLFAAMAIEGDDCG
jgi:hypothetical protein